MSFPRLVSEAKIERLKKEQEKREEHWAEIGHDPERNGSLQAALLRKERWLEVYSQCLSPSLTCRQVGVAMSTYRKWRSEDADFCERLNGIIMDWREELMGSAIARAIGYTAIDDAGNIVTDASGKVVYHGASDSLARQLLQLDAGEQKSNATVNVTIDLGAFLGQNSATHEKAIEGEYTPVDDSAA